MKHAGTWYALWSDGQQVIFQVGTKQFPMTDAYQCRNVRFDATRKFTISEKECVSFEVTYDAFDRDDDPSFDLADLEQEDFFFFTSRLWSDSKWRQEVVKNWAA